MSEEWVTDAMSKIDVNHDNFLSYVPNNKILKRREEDKENRRVEDQQQLTSYRWPEFGTKIKLINQLRASSEQGNPLPIPASLSLPFPSSIHLFFLILSILSYSYQCLESITAAKKKTAAAEVTAPPKTSLTASPDLESRTVPILKREDVVYKSVRNLLGEEKEVVDLVFSEEQVADMDKGLEDGGETSATTLDLEERTKGDGEVEEKEIHEPVQRPTAMDVEDTKKEDEGEVQTIHVTVRSQDEIAPHSVEDDEVDEREVFVIMEQQIVKTNEVEMKQEARLQHEVEEEEEEMRTEVRAGEKKSEGAVAREDKREEREVPVEIKVELEGDGTTDVRPDDFADLVSLSPSCSLLVLLFKFFILFCFI